MQLKKAAEARAWFGLARMYYSVSDLPSVKLTENLNWKTVFLVLLIVVPWYFSAAWYFSVEKCQNQMKTLEKLQQDSSCEAELKNCTAELKNCTETCNNQTCFDLSQVSSYLPSNLNPWSGK